MASSRSSKEGSQEETDSAHQHVDIHNGVTSSHGSECSWREGGREGEGREGGRGKGGERGERGGEREGGRGDGGEGGGGVIEDSYSL